jgi:hypothetical protein
MQRSRLLGLATVLVSALAFAQLATGCGAQGQVGDACTRDFDCESDRCVQQVCVLPNTSPIGSGDATTTEAAAETGDAAPEAAQEAAAEAAAETSTDTGAGGG